ncbi:MAG: DUF503 family protein [Gammaproteobacteria bacterium]|nr:DUF503 family protein [Gammaproteobacteria bacterium]
MTAGILLLNVQFDLDGCSSLKERRQRLGGLRQRLGRETSVALCEHPGDDPGASAWSIVIIASSQRSATELAGRIERDLESRVDAVVSGISREWL